MLARALFVASVTEDSPIKAPMNAPKTRPGPVNNDKIIPINAPLDAFIDAPEFLVKYAGMKKSMRKIIISTHYKEPVKGTIDLV